MRADTELGKGVALTSAPPETTDGGAVELDRVAVMSTKKIPSGDVSRSNIGTVRAANHNSSAG